jgi:hypothetical protein
VHQLTIYNLIKFVRYFTGNTKNPDGSVQFIKGETKVSKAIDGVIKILTVAVSEVPGFAYAYVLCDFLTKCITI